MNFKKLFSLASLVVMALASTAVHADIKNKKGWHYIKMVNNSATGQSLFIKITNRGGGVHNKCIDVAPWRTVADKSFLVKNGDVVQYNRYIFKSCYGRAVATNQNTIHSDADEYWYFWY